MPLDRLKQFWSSVDLTGNQTNATPVVDYNSFWSSVDLTGNQTMVDVEPHNDVFWSSVDLTGNQTKRYVFGHNFGFWSSVDQDRVPNVGVRGRFPGRRKQEAVIAWNSNR